MKKILKLQLLILQKTVDCKKSIAQISSKIQKIKPNEFNELAKLTIELREASDELAMLNAKQKNIYKNEKIKQMLDGFYEYETCYVSLIYPYVYKFTDCSGKENCYGILNCSGWVYFNTLDDAKNYAMAHSRDNWLEYAYNYV